MATRKKAPQTLVLDSALPEDSDYTATLDYPDDAQAPLCPCCGELLAWHEEPCSGQVKPTAQPAAEEAETPGNVLFGLTPSPFAYALGQPVQPAPNAPAKPIVWRGQVKERHPRTGLIHRVNVYRLDNGYWDCYYETELQAA